MVDAGVADAVAFLNRTLTGKHVDAYAQGAFYDRHQFALYVKEKSLLTNFPTWLTPQKND